MSVSLAKPAPIADLRHPAKNFIALFLSQVFGMTSGLIFGFVAARLLGAGGFGDYALINAFLSYSLVLTEFGLSPFLVREMSQRPADRISILASGLLLRLTLATLSFTGIVLVGFWLHLSWLLLGCLALAGLGTLLYAWNSSLTDLLTAHERLRWAAYLDMFCQIVFLAIVITLLWKSSNILSIFVALFLANSVRALALGFFARKDIRQIRWKNAQLSSCRGLLKEAFIFGLLGFMGMLYFKIDILVLYAFRPGNAVGWYEGAYRFLEAAMVLSSSLMTALFPMLSRMGSVPESSHELHQTFLRATKFLIVSGLFSALAISCIATPLVRFCYGATFLPAVPLVPVLMAALVLVQINAPNSRLLLALGNQKQMLGLFSIALGVNVLLDFALIPRWGAYGAAFATVLSEMACLTLLYPAVVSRAGSLPWASLLGKPLACSGAFLAFWFLLGGISPWASLLAGSIAFLACFAALRVFDPTDLKILRQAFGSTP